MAYSFDPAPSAPVPNKLLQLVDIIEPDAEDELSHQCYCGRVERDSVRTERLEEPAVQKRKGRCQ